jgi:hypothetical protein
MTVPLVVKYCSLIRNNILNGPTVSPAPDVSSGVIGVIGSGSGHDGVMGTIREEVENPNMNPENQPSFRGERWDVPRV